MNRSKLITAGAVVGVLVILALLLTVVRLRTDVDKFGRTVTHADSTLNQIEAGSSASQGLSRERAYATRAISCTATILDNDRNFDLTPACTTPEITAYYPLNLCSKYFPTQLTCGSKVNESAL